MPYDYTDPKRADDTYALPDVELFYLTAADILAILADNGFTVNDDDEICNADGTIADEAPFGGVSAGWYYRYGFPGCLPDSDPYGPYDSEAAALASAREHAGIDDIDDSEAANG